jgi:hypothetical protein
MVNGWLKSRDNGPNIGRGGRPAQSERIFATKAALTSANQCRVHAQKSFWIKRFLVY